MNFRFSPAITRDGIENIQSIQNIQDHLACLFRHYGLENNNFLTALSLPSLLENMDKLAKDFSLKKRVIHIGMGGSSHGAEMLVKALGKKPSPSFCFLNNSDPEQAVPAIEQSLLEETLFLVVSQSGRTVETSALLSLVLGRFQKLGIPKQEWKRHLILCTSPLSPLATLAGDLSLPLLATPEGVGGRWSALSPAGLFPAKLCGVNISQLLDSALNCLDQLPQWPLSTLADVIDHLYNEEQISQIVSMPYSHPLESFNPWFAQLWAESLGKDGLGLTPLQALGARDQHSQMQLFMDGPKDKFFIFIKVEQRKEKGVLPSSSPHPILHDLAGTTLENLIHCQLEGTLASMDQKDIPYLLINLNRLEEKEIGSLIIFFQVLTLLLGERLQVNPFDQPGVERAKSAALSLLKSHHPEKYLEKYPKE